MAQSNRKGYKGKGMEGFIARYYDKTARNHMMSQYRAYVEWLQMPRDARVLEVASGPGYLAIELALAGCKSVTGMDISSTFVDIARENARQAGVAVDFCQGDVSEMPFDDGAYSHIICTASFKNFSQPVDALREMYRVLAPGGTAWISDMRREVTDDEIRDYVRNEMQLRGWNRFLTEMTFRKMLRKRAYTRNAMLQLIEKTRFQIEDFQSHVLEFYLTLKKT